MSDGVINGRLRFVESLPPGNVGMRAEDLLRHLDESLIGIGIGNAGAHTLEAQVTALSAVNLLARLFRRFAIRVPCGTAVHDSLPFLDGELGSALVSFASRVHRDVHIELVNSIPETAITLRIADSDAPDTPHQIYAAGSGWLARVARRPLALPVPSDHNPVGPLIAAALGAAEIFKIVMHDALPGIVHADDVSFSALTYRVGDIDPGPPLTDIHVPETTLVGAGSIGSSMLWGLTHLRDAHGILAIVDPDALEVHNPDRAVLVLDDAAANKLEKASWARDMIQPWLPNLDIRPFPGTIRAYVDTLPPDYTLPLAISAVDSIESRRDVQDALPQQILNASTGPTSVEISRHASLGDGPCLYCLYLPELLTRSPIQIAVERTGFSQRDIAELMIPDGKRTLVPANVRGIERRNGLPEGSLHHYVGRRLPDLLRDQRMYSQAPVQLDRGHALVTTAFVSALAGFLLLAELLKTADPTLAHHQLTGVYEQELLGLPNAFRCPIPRDATGHCLCHDPLRRRLSREKYATLPSSP